MFEWLLNLFSKKRRIEYKNTTIKKKLFKNFKNCHYCGEQLYSLDDASLDHMTPLFKRWIK